ncbi:transferase [Streptomyces sp. IMTB 2501]|uniref:transferase n=1 Tax=Streptomyces sp. IMTB 2501 TaxID=1776340 RepID=UPI00096CCE6B|nr:transferase [Streptomyces sp. IMTB 2501]OLZ61285.1 transferase [Streptomyces sp. IMTB 2501]
MSSGLRVFARLVMVCAVVTGYVALQLAVGVGLDLRARDRFRDAPARAAAFVTALDRYAAGDASARAGIREGEAWFEDNAPSGQSRSAVVAAAREAREGGSSLARERVAGLAARVEKDQAVLERDLGSSGMVALWWAVAAGVLAVPALWLRCRRRAGAAGVVGLVSRFAPRQPWWRRPLFLAASGLGYGLFAIGFLAVSTAERQGYKQPVVAQILLLPCGLAALGAGLLILRRSRPRSVRSAAQALLADGRTPVLYLRSFADDATTAQIDDGMPVNVHSREEQLAAALGAVGPVIAVGMPEEPLPRLGAARFYLPRDDWQPVVLRLMELSRLIVLRLGLGDGLWWEVEQARATQPARKLVLMVPGGLPGVAERLDEHLPTPARLDKAVAGDSSVSAISAVITFDPEWTPHVHAVGATTRRRLFARLAAFAERTGVAGTAMYTPAYREIRAMKAALAAVGLRKRTMTPRANFALGASLWKGMLLVTVLGLLGWLVFRTLRLLELW